MYPVPILIYFSRAFTFSLRAQTVTCRANSYGAASEAKYKGFLKGALTTRKGASIAVVDGDERHSAGACLVSMHGKEP